MKKYTRVKTPLLFITSRMDIKKAIARAERHESKIDSNYMVKLNGLSSPNIWRTMNNLGSEAKNYFEIGTYMGSSLMATTYKNNLNAYACDNFCMKPNLRNHFFQNVKKLDFTFIEKDCFHIERHEIPEPIEFYFFDGRHEYEDQYRAISYFVPFMAKEFVYVCDDWSNKSVKDGTMDAIKFCKLEIVEMEVRGDGKWKDKDGWWCGFACFKLKKYG